MDKKLVNVLIASIYGSRSTSGFLHEVIRAQAIADFIDTVEAVNKSGLTKPMKMQLRPSEFGRFSNGFEIYRENLFGRENLLRGAFVQESVGGNPAAEVQLRLQRYKRKNETESVGCATYTQETGSWDAEVNDILGRPKRTDLSLLLLQGLNLVR